MANFIHSFQKRSQIVWKKTMIFIDSKPFGSFFVLLGILLILIVVGNFLRKPTTEEEAHQAEPKLVETYSFGESPKMAFTARVEKAGVISVYAQSPGIVQKIHLSEGKRVNRAGTLVSLSTTYQGANVASLSRQIAQKNFDSATTNFDLQKDIISKQRELAEKGNIQAEQLREITRQSLDDTRALISLNESIVSSLDQQIVQLEITNVGGINDSAIAGAKQGKAGALAGLSQLRSSLRLSEYQSDEEKTPAELSDSSKELTLRQLDLQERGLVLSKDVAQLNVKLARVSESMMFPASPCNGVVERVYVKVGQSVAPGTLIATIKADQGENTAVVLVPREIALQVSKTEESEFLIDDKKVGLIPRYVSTESTDGNLYSILYSVPNTYSSSLTAMGTLEVTIPMGSKKIVTDELYVPLDSIYQTQEKSYVYVLKKEGDSQKASVKEVSLAEVSGIYAKVSSGLSSSDVVILSRNIEEGETLRTQ